MSDQDPFSPIKEDRRNAETLSAREVNALHSKSDRDSGRDSQHHTLGSGANQASPGDHKHDGRTSSLLGAGITISGSKGGNAALASVISAMVTMFGVNDTTT